MMPPSNVARVGPSGVMTLRGGTLALQNFSLSIGPDGEVSATIEPMLAWEIWPLWLRIAIENERASAVARDKLLQPLESDTSAQLASERRSRHVEEETRAGLASLTAAAFSIEAMARSAVAATGLSGVGTATSTAKRVCEALKQSFDLPQFMEWRALVIQIFKGRNAAVHPDAGLRSPLPHPALNARVPWPAHFYCYENAKGAVDVALHTALVASRNPKARHGKSFRSRIGAWEGFVAELRDLRVGLASSD